MTLSDMLQIYGAAIVTLSALAASVRYLISSRIEPLESKIDELRKGEKDIDTDITSLKKEMVSDVKEISQGNYEFRLKYEQSIQELRLLLAEKYTSKEDLEKEIRAIKERVTLCNELKSIRRHIEDIKRDKEGRK